MTPFFFAWDRDGEKTRERMLEAILQDPGIHLAELGKRLGLSWSTVSYHARQLAKQGRIQVEKGFRERRLYGPQVPALHKPWLAALRDEDTTRVLHALLEAPASVRQLGASLGLSHKVIRRHLATLEQSGLVHRRGDTRTLFEVSAADVALIDPAGLRRGGDRPRDPEPADGAK